MDIKDLEKLAMNNAELPDNLTQPQQLLFLQLRILYDSFSSGRITKEQGSQEKQKLIAEYEVADLHFRANKKTAEHLVVLGERISDCYKNKENCPVCKGLAERWGHSDYGEVE